MPSARAHQHRRFSEERNRMCGSSHDKRDFTHAATTASNDTLTASNTRLLSRCAVSLKQETAQVRGLLSSLALGKKSAFGSF